MEHRPYQRALTEEDTSILMRQFGSIQALESDSHDFYMTLVCLRGIGVKSYVRLRVLSLECRDEREEWLDNALGSWM